MEYMYNISIIFVCDTDTAVERFRLLTEDRLFAMGSQRFKYQNVQMKLFCIVSNDLK